jgi:hypothetical protein
VPLALQTVLALAVLAGLFYAAWRFDRWRKPQNRALRRLRNLPLCPLSRLAEGQPVRTLGTVRKRGELLRAPFSGRSCVCYEAVVEGWNHNRLRFSNWYLLAREVRATRFGLELGGASADVVAAIGEPVDALLRADEEQRSDVLHKPTPEMESFLERLGRSAHGLVLPRTLRYREGIVEAGEMVVAAGLVTRRVERPAFVVEGEDGSPVAHWQLSGGPAGPLFLSDDPHVVKAQADEHNRSFTGVGATGRGPGSR